tara:strand:- start:2112 stop:3812 length:1701 start_codon:yes stop_codon:yes gene_type:complete
MFIKIVKSVFKFLNFKQIILYIISNLIHIFSKVFELLGILTILPIIILLINQQQPKYLLKVSEYINTDFFLNKDISFYLFILLVTFTMKHLILLAFIWTKLKIEKYIVSDLYINLLKVFTNYNFIKFKTYTQGELIRNILTESKNFERLAFSVFDLLFNIIFVFILIILILNVGNITILVPYFISIILIIYIFYKILKNKMVMISNEIANYSVRVSESIIDSTNLYLEKKLKNLKSNFFKRYFAFFDYFIKQKNIQTLLNSLPKSIIELSIIIFFIFFLIYKLNFEKDSQLVFEEFFIILATLSRIMPSISLIQNNINSIYFSKRSLENISHELLILKNKKAENINIQNFKKKKINSLELKNISFNYKKKIIFKNIKFKANKGEIIGIMGSSGVGKSTLGLIIAGILEPKSGLILINNEKLKKNKKIYNEFGNVGYVSQNVHLLNDTLKNNITFSFGDKIDILNYKKSIQISEVQSFLSKNRGKDNIYLKNDGSNLSVGQRQRVAIARAIYHSDEVLILDEATSNLDSLTEDLIFKNLKKIKKNLIIFVITHKKKNIKFFNKLIKL